MVGEGAHSLAGNRGTGVRRKEEVSRRLGRRTMIWPTDRSQEKKELGRAGESSLCDPKALLLFLVLLPVLLVFACQGGDDTRINEITGGGVSLLARQSDLSSPTWAPAMEASTTDAALVKRVRRGDARAFETLVRRHVRAAHAVALSVLGNSSDADDVCQDAFLSALTKIEQCRKPGSFRAWLLTIVRNRALGFRAKEAVRASTPLDFTGELAGKDDASRAVERRELREDLAVALEELTPSQRRVVVLHDLEGWTHDEIAKEVGISVGASRVHLHMGRKALRALVAPRHLKGA